MICNVCIDCIYICQGHSGDICCTGCAYSLCVAGSMPTMYLYVLTHSHATDILSYFELFS